MRLKGTFDDMEGTTRLNQKFSINRNEQKAGKMKWELI